ncbi:MAG: M12 family metallopeptidase [Trueperaceae bacterium]
MLLALVACDTSKEAVTRAEGVVSYPELAYDPNSSEIGALANNGWKEYTFSNGETFHYQVIRGDVFVDGDIRLGTEKQINEEIAKREEELKKAKNAKPSELTAQGSGIKACTLWVFVCVQSDEHAYKWANGVIRHSYGSTFSSSQLTDIHNAMNHIATNTPIRFENVGSYPRVVIRATTEDSCSADVGKRWTYTDSYVTLGPKCSYGTIIHELLHTIGLWHEQSRCDRDNYVTIYTNNVTPSSEKNNFDKHCGDGTDIGSYDYDSIMHYRTTAFAKSGTVTISPKGGVSSSRLGQRLGLSPGDIYSINKRYGWVSLRADDTYSEVGTFSRSKNKASELVNLYAENQGCSTCEYYGNLLNPNSTYVKEIIVQPGQNSLYAWLRGDGVNYTLTLEETVAGKTSEVARRSTNNDGDSVAQIEYSIKPNANYQWVVHPTVTKESSFDLWTSSAF